VIQFNCGVVFHDQKRFAEAVVAYEAALALDSDFTDAHRYLHECYEALGQQQLAIRHASAWLRGGDTGDRERR
jgi:tetratricopeptide (TPR) repeat protein